MVRSLAAGACHQGARVPVCCGVAMAGHFLLGKAARNFTLADVEKLTDAQVLGFFAKQRWGAFGDGVQACPDCGSIDSHYVVHGRQQWRCKVTGCARTFSVTSGTAFQDHKLPLKTILRALVLYLTSVKGISASQLARTLGVAYQTAFVLLNKLRDVLLETRDITPLSEHVEIDGGYFSGVKRKPRVRVKSTERKWEWWMERGPDQRVVLVLRQKSQEPGKGGTRTIVEVIPSETRDYINPLVKRFVQKGTTIHTDQGRGFADLKGLYRHATVVHTIEYCTADGVNNNQAESFFARVRRLVRGQIHRMTKTYMLAYVNEIAWREDVRRESTLEQLSLLLGKCFKTKPSDRWLGYWQRRKASLFAPDPVWGQGSDG